LTPATALRPILGYFSATAIVVASMIGTGIFTTTGFLALDLPSPGMIIGIWLVGGLLALCGALSYGELAAALPRSGGEYHFLSSIYHPLAGFLAGWISLIVGFSAPIAAAAMAFGKYTAAVIPAFPPIAGAVALVLVVSILHAADVKGGSYFQNVFTVLKVTLLALFIVGGLGRAAVPAPEPSPVGNGWFNPALAVGLIFVSFAYSGWNGAVYVLGEVRRSERTLPLALVSGTLLVTLLYVLLNVVFLRAVPLTELAGTVEVGHLAATRLFGARAGDLISLLIALALISSVSAMVMTGPRVYHTAGQDYSLFSAVAKLSRRGTPMVAIALQATIAIIMILTASFDRLLNYIGFTLSLSTGLTVAGVLVLRWRNPGLPRPYRTWGYPVTPLLYVLLSLWMVTYNVAGRPLESLAGLTTLALGAGLYWISRRTRDE
jgi:APA family basic amino acid/polyamine antiporter